VHTNARVPHSRFIAVGYNVATIGLCDRERGFYWPDAGQISDGYKLARYGQDELACSCLLTRRL